MPSSNTSEKRPARGVAGRKLAATCVVLLCLLAALAGRHLLFTASSESNFDPTPLPRPRINAPFITTPDLVVEKMVELAEVSEDDLVYDLGCGDGRIVITAALKSGCRGIGFDIDPARVAEARENARLNGVEDRVTIEEQDVFTVDLSKVDVAMTYLLPWMMNELLPQFERMKPGARIVAHDFWIDGVEPDAYVEVSPGENIDAHGIYLYTVPLRKNAAIEKGKPPRPADWLPVARASEKQADSPAFKSE